MTLFSTMGSSILLGMSGGLSAALLLLWLQTGRPSVELGALTCLTFGAGMGWFVIILVKASQERLFNEWVNRTPVLWTNARPGVNAALVHLAPQSWVLVVAGSEADLERLDWLSRANHDPMALVRLLWRQGLWALPVIADSRDTAGRLLCEAVALRSIPEEGAQ